MTRGYFVVLFLRGVARQATGAEAVMVGGLGGRLARLGADTGKLRGGVTDLQGRWWFGALRCAVFGLGWRKETG